MCEVCIEKSLSPFTLMELLYKIVITMELASNALNFHGNYHSEFVGFFLWLCNVTISV